MNILDADRDVLDTIRDNMRRGNVGQACTLLQENKHLAAIALEMIERDTSVSLFDKLAFFECVRDLS